MSSSSILIATQLDKNKQQDVLHNDLNKVVRFNEIPPVGVALSEVLYESLCFNNVREGDNYVKFQYVDWVEKFTGYIRLFVERVQFMHATEEKDLNQLRVKVTLKNKKVIVSSTFNFFKKKQIYASTNAFNKNLKWYWWGTRGEGLGEEVQFGDEYDKLDIQNDKENEKSSFQMIFIGVQNQKVFDGMKSTTVLIPPGFYNDNESFVAKVRELIRWDVGKIAYETRKRYTAGRVMFKFRKVIEYCDLQYNDGHASLIIDGTFSRAIRLSVKWSPSLAYLLGYTSKLTGELEWYYPEPTMLSSNEHHPLASEANRETGGWISMWVGRNVVDLSRMTFNALWVYCDAIQSNHVCNLQQQLLRVVPNAEISKVPANYNIFGNLILCPLNKNNLNSISLWFKESPMAETNLDIHGEVIVRLSFDEMLNNFPLTLQSGKKDGGDMQVNLNTELDFRDMEYEVSLNDIIFIPGSWNNVRLDNNWVTLYNKDILGNKKLTINIPSRNYTRAEDLLHEINLEIYHVVRFKYAEDVWNRTQKTKEQKPYHSVAERDKWYTIGGEFVLKDTRESLEKMKNDFNELGSTMGVFYSWSRAEFIKYNEMWQPGQNYIGDAYARGYRWNELSQRFSSNLKYVWTTYDVQHRTGIRVSPGIAMLLGLIPNLYAKVSTMWSGHEELASNIDMSRTNINMLYVYADFIQSTMIGPLQAPLLKIVPIFHISGAVNHSVFENTEFVRVHKRMINNIRIYMKTSLDALDTLQCNEPVTYVLYFKAA